MLFIDSSVKKGQFPFSGSTIMAKNIGGPVITFHFKVPVVGSQPPVKEFHHLDHSAVNMKTTGRLLTPIPGITFYPNGETRFT